jgi:hypothetical protein
MPAVVPLEELKRIQEELEALKLKHPEAYQDFVRLFNKSRGVGYKNIAKLLMEEKIPEELKG